MAIPTHAALVDRARTLVERMHEVERWAYALELAVAQAQLQPAILRAGYTLAEVDSEAKAARYAARDGADILVTLERPDLGLVLVQAHGPGTVDRLSSILDATGFVRQSRLLAKAYSAGDGEASSALHALAHMVVAFDDDWAELFLLHLASPDPVVRHDAVISTVIAAMSAGESEPARTLLAEAHARESFPKLKETLGEAIRTVEGLERTPLVPS